jgi:hypothetical protein
LIDQCTRECPALVAASVLNADRVELRFRPGGRRARSTGIDYCGQDIKSEGNSSDRVDPWDGLRSKHCAGGSPGFGELDTKVGFG